MRRVLLLTTLVLAATAPRAQAKPPDPVVAWNRELLSILRTPGAQPATVQPTRNMALLHAAIGDAVSAIDHSARPLLVRVDAPRRASREAAIDAAAHDVLAALYPSLRTQLDQLEPARAGAARGAAAGRPTSAGPRGRPPRRAPGARRSRERRLGRHAAAVRRAQ